MAREKKTTNTTAVDGLRFARVMSERARPDRLVDLPGVKGEKVRLWCPKEGEESEANVAARKYLTEEHGLTALQLSLAVETELFRREYELELLAAVLRDPDDPSQAYVESADELREHMEAPQRERLIALVESFRSERFLLDLPEDPEKVVEVIRGLKEQGRPSDFLMSSDSDTLMSIIDVLAEELFGKPTAPSSSGT